MSDETQSRYWARTRGLMIMMMILWVIFGYIIHMFVRELNEIVIFGFPLGFYMAAQGSLVVFLVMLFWFAWRQDAIDRAEGVSEDD